MCGIVGSVDFAGRPVRSARLADMTRLVRHRGPDGEGTWVRDSLPGASVALGHRRLAVLDLSDCASQPMHNAACVAAGRGSPLTLVFNGDIYNFQDLRRDLVAHGHRFVSNTDSEVILHLYEEHGPACVEALRGMFAFVIWDEKRQQAVCARDRVGKKPLYYRLAGQRFWFASEVRAILADPDVPVTDNPEAIHAYLRLGFVPGPDSAFAGVQRLRPGHVMVVSDSGVAERPYWRLEYEPKLAISEADAVADLQHRLREAVRLRLVSDVPLGAFLSGGIDSSAVVALMCAESAEVETFSIGFEDDEYNELPYARQVASHLGTRHREFTVRAAAADVAGRLAWHYGEPYADSSAVPAYYLARMARQHITVALNGDGGDESFGGYARYSANRSAASYQRLPGPVRMALERTADSLRTASSKSIVNRAQRFLKGAGRPFPARYASWFEFFEPYVDLLDPEFLKTATEDTALSSLARAFGPRASLDPAEAAMATDVAVYLPDDLLVKIDIATMAHGLEARSPLLDQDLMEFAARLPVHFKIRGRTRKWILKKALEAFVPRSILERPKVGFGVPLDRWFRGPLSEMAGDLLLGSESRTARYVRAGATARLLDEHQRGQATHGHRLWALLMLELWHRTYLSGARPVPLAPPEPAMLTG